MIEPAMREPAVGSPPELTPVRAAFRDECVRLAAELRDLTETDLDRATNCPPWTVRELLAHVHTGVGRLAGMLAAPAPPRAQVDAAGYFSAAKFTPSVDADRINGGHRAGRCLDAATLADDLDRARRATLDAIDAQPPGRLVRTRHGDAMTMLEFLRTRVVEVGVHGLDVAAALERRPWLTPAAAAVLADLFTGGQPVPAALGWDRLTLIRKTTGRLPLTPAEQATAAAVDFRWLSFAP